MPDAPVYPIALRLRDRRALVVGAGAIGQDKTERLLACAARVTLVSPAATPHLRDLASEGSITWHERGYAASDLDGAFLVIAATSDTALNTQVSRDAQKRGLLVNVVDVPSLSNFIVPAITRAGPIAVAVSTSGASPALAQRMRDEIAAAFGEPYARLAEILNELRSWARESLPTYQARRAFFSSIVNGRPDPVELLRVGDESSVRELVERARRDATA